MLGNLNRYKVGYKTLSMQIEDNDWDEEEGSTVKTIIFIPSERHIVRQ